MLDSLEIQNYRNFKHLTIEKLGRVNLIIGKNNTGKSSLLEAVSLYLIADKVAALSNIFSNRGLLKWGWYAQITYPQIFLRENLQLFESIFTGRNIQNAPIISIGEISEAVFTIEAKMTDNQSTVSLKESSGLDIDLSKNSFITPSPHIGKNRNGCLYIPSQIPVDAILTDIPQIWSEIIFTEYERYIIEALNIIENTIQRFGYVYESNEQKPKVGLSTGEVVDLRSMGDGLNQVLHVVLALIASKDRTLLIDEFDNGLHHSVQEKLWEIVFYLANKLNIQVFATTHSYDCIDAFAQVLGSGKYDENDGLMVRLDNIDGEIEPTIYEPRMIFNTTRLQIDPR